MTPSKSKKAKQRQKRRRERRQKPFESLKRKLEQGPLRGKEFVVELRGEVKMSEVLTDFIEPYLEFTDTEEAYRKLLALAIVAWNTSLFPEEKQQDMIDGTLEAMPETAEEVKTGLKEIVTMLIARKKAYFSDYRRMIVDFDLADTGRGYYLTVASTVEGVPSK